MRRAPAAWPGIILLITACGFGPNPKTPGAGGQLCNMAIAGAPHSGTYTTCNAVKNGDGSGTWSISGGGLPGCPDCLSGGTVPGTGTLECNCQPTNNCQATSDPMIVVSDPAWSGPDGGPVLVGTACNIQGDPCAAVPPVPSCTISTNSVSPGHWSGDITAQVVFVSVSAGLPVTNTASITIKGAF